MTQTAEQLAALLPVLGIKLTPEQLEERVVEQIVARILNQEAGEIDLSEYDEDEDYGRRTKRSFQDSVRHRALAAIRERLDVAVTKYFDEHMTGKFDEIVRGILFPKTNQYGEKKGQTETLLEHFERQARAYMEAKVDYEGREERDGYGRSGTPRLVWMLQKAIKTDLDTAIKRALEQVAEVCGEQIKAVVAGAAAKVKVHT